MRQNGTKLGRCFRPLPSPLICQVRSYMVRPTGGHLWPGLLAGIWIVDGHPQGELEKIKMTVNYFLLMSFDPKINKFGRLVLLIGTFRLRP
jgi:hypothetical protein